MKPIVLIVLSLLGFVLTRQDVCSQYKTCRTCLDIPPGKSEGGREWCGWCHVPITYQNGTNGGQCVDQRDDPHHCNDLFDTYKCSKGWKCTDKVAGKCEQTDEGAGYGSKDRCQEYCQPHPHPKTYQCNITNYQCERCKDQETPAPGCKQDRKEACDNCEAPPTVKFRCDRTDKENPSCKRCNQGDQGCGNQKQVCKDCAPPAKLMKCNTTSFQCEKDESGMIEQACNASCGKITPSNLLGPWRGLMVKQLMKGQFVMGEFDMMFGDSNLTLRWPNQTQQIFDVATSGFSIRLTESTTGKVYQAINNEIAYLKHTTAMGFAAKGPGQPAPDSFGGAMKDTESTAWVMWKCNGNDKTKCDFSPKQLADELRGPNDIDSCNKYPDCHSCITASEGDVSCGWCQGGTLDYKDAGQTKFKCGGYKAGEPYKFTCPRAFKTEDCQGYNCNWSNNTCVFSEQGQWPDEDACKKICKPDPHGMKVCNLTTKKCDSCKQGDPGCNTDAYCQASCNLTYSKCNDTIGVCKPCERGSDPNCTETKSVCDAGCKIHDHSKAVCNKTSGKCKECDPQHSGKGCIPKDSCDKQCKPDPHHDEQYECVWQADPPKCKKSDAGTYTEKECNDACKAPDFAKCDFKNNKCVGCTVGKDKNCMYSLDYCKIMQERGKCKPQTLQGLFRMIMVQKGYPIGEFDIMFDGAGKAAEQMYVISKTSLGHGKMEVTQHSDVGESVIHFTEWTGNAAMPGVKEGWGVYKLKDGSSQILTVLELAMSKDQITTLDDGLKQGNAYYVGVACKDTKNCDFSKATPAMALTLPSEYYEFLDEQFIQ